MHNIIKIACLGLVLGTVPACVSLEEEPKAVIAPGNFYKTEADAQAAVTAAYRQLSEFSYYLVMHIMVDNASDNSNEGRANILAKAIDQYTMDADNGQITNFWGAIFIAVNHANTVIEYVPNCTMDPQKKKEIIAEGKFLRALSYYNLVRLFGDVPLLTRPTVSLENLDQPRTPTSEVYAQIVLDLEEAAADLPASWPATFHGRATKGAAQSLLASVHLTRENWDKARDYARLVIDNPAYSLFPDIEGLWLVANQNAPEFIFSLQAKPNVQVPNFLTQRFMPRIIGGTGIAWVENAFYNSFNDKDLRKKVSFWTSVTRDGKETPYTQWSDPFIHIGKFKDGGPGYNPANGQGEANLPIIRFAEVQLIYAEAVNALNGPTPEAYEAINKVRRRAYKKPINTPDPESDLQPVLSQAQFRDAVLQERAWELCFEWKRWFDLTRTRRLVEVMKTTRPLITEKHYLYPIPQQQLNVNKNLVQNPGYEK